MMLMSVAAIPELLLVGINATMANAQPYRVNEYSKLNRKNKNQSNFLKIPATHIIDVTKEVHNEIPKNNINHAVK